MSDPPQPLHLGVAREELEKGLRTLRRTFPRRRRMPEALLTYEEGDLVVRIGGAQVRASAWGRWSGVVRAAGQLLTTLDRFLPESDPIPVRVSDGRLKVGRSSFPCAWQESVPDRVLVPVDASLLHLLRLPMERGAAAI